MSVAFDHRDPGTAEELWQRARPWRDAPELHVDARRLVVISAHPDDETLGAGGLIAWAARTGIPVSVVVATDGEASHPRAAGLRLRRRGELLGALHELAEGCPVHFLALPDGGLREAADELRRSLRAIACTADLSRTTIVAPWWGDGHRDHRVAGEVAAEFAAHGARVLGYPIWYWHWGDPQTADAAPWRVLALDEETRTAKARALGRHVSQTTETAGAEDGDAMLHVGMLRHFERDVEVFVEVGAAPRTSTPVASFDARYARSADPWGVDSRWYERRKRELMLASLPRERFGRTLEIGCGTGALTARLAERCDAVVALDVSPRAVASTQERIGGSPSVTVHEADARSTLPAGPFDLVVLSELAYYWDAADLERVVASIDGELAHNGVLAVCHWRHPIAEAPSTGDEAHALLAATGRFASLVRHREEDFVLEILGRPGTRGVAAETGLVP